MNKKINKATKKTNTKINSAIKITILVLMILGIALPAIGYETPTQKSIRIKNTRYDPFPVEPGSYFEFWIKIENFGSADISDFKFRLVPEYPFSLDPNENQLREFGMFSAGEQALFKYKVRTDINAVEGVNPLHYEYNFGGAQWNMGQFNVDVYTLDAILSVEDVTTSKEAVSPGDEVGVSIKLKNLADSSLKDIKVKLNFIEFEQTLSGAQVVELPISPTGSSDEKTIKIMEGGSEEAVNFDLVVDPSAEAKVYKIPVTITYNDLQGTNYSKNNIISLTVGGEPDLAVTLDASTAHMAGNTGEVIVKFVNKGFSEIKFMYVVLEEGENFEVLSPKESYLGNIDSDDYETAEYEIYVDPKVNGEIILPITIEYKDSNNNPYTKNIKLQNRIYTSEEAKKFGIVKSGGTGGIVVVLIIVGIGLFFYRRWKKRKNNKQGK
jgi:hypothetical protein